MRIRDQCVPLFLRHRLDGIPTVGSLTGLRSAEDESAGVSRIAEDLKRPGMAQWSPDQLPPVGAVAKASGEAQTVLVEVFHDGQRRTFPLIDLEEGAQSLLDLPIRIEDDFAL